MANLVIQSAFHAGEWAPALYGRVDLAKYHAACALARNFFVDYRGGLSTTPGTKYILRAFKSSTNVRLIPFAASFTVNYVLEFGDFYIRFYNNGAPVLETAIALTAATSASPGVFTKNAHGLFNGDWVFASGFAGGSFTTLNSKYFIVAAAAANTFQLTDLYGVAVSTLGFGTWSAGSVQRVYTLPSPYAAADLALVKFAQNVNTLVLAHPSYVPYLLTLISAANWTIAPITFGSTVTTPTGTGIATSAAGAYNFSYVVTAVDFNGQESNISAVMSSTAAAAGATLTPSWTAVSGAQSYNVYRTSPSTAGAVPSGSSFGFVANVTGTSFADYIQPNGVALNSADFTETIPIAENPFQGAGVASGTVTASGSPLATPVPSITFGAAPTGGVTATGTCTAGVIGTPALVVASGHGAVSVGDVYSFGNGVLAIVATIAGADVATFQPITYPGSNPGAILSGGTIPGNPVTGTNLTHGGQTCTANLNWGITAINVLTGGAGYTSAPAITFSAGAATATSSLAPSSAGNPSVPAYFQQRLVLAGPSGSPQQFNMSQPGSYYNYNISDPIQADDAIKGTIVSNQLNTIKSMLPMPAGLVVFGDRQAFLINGGSAQTPITPIDANAQAQAYNGAADVPPIVVNYDIIYVQAKGSYVRDLTYNFYTNIYTGTDISILSSHLFYGYKINEWAYAEEPFKLIWCVRSDGTVLILTFVKEQELVGWTHRDTNGLFKSVASITETVTLSDGRSMTVDSVYFCIQRTINGQTVQYIERLAERIFPNGAADAWCVDAGLQYSGTPATSFSGGEHLTGATCVGLADGAAITPFVMAATGNFTLPSAASKVTIGLAFTPQFTTLPLDVGEPTVQGKQKRTSPVIVRVQETLGLSIGSSLGSSLVAMKDLVVGNVGSLTNTVVSGLVTGDVQTGIDPIWTEQGQISIQQSNPFPATILAVIPEIVVGDTSK